MFWHTQGSGKSFLMIFLTENIHRKISAKYTFVVLTERERIKEVAKELLDKLLSGKLQIDHWR